MPNKSFKWDAKLYQESSSFQFNLDLMAIEKLNPKVNENILEIGCGNAKLTIELAKKIPSGTITAIELSEDMVNQAEENLNKQQVKNIKIVNRDAININYENQFDAVFSNSAIHWIKNLETMYNLIYKSLKQKGRIIIQTGLKENNNLFRSLLEIINLKEFKQFFKNFSQPWRFLTQNETEFILQQNNFQDINVESYKYIVTFKTETEMINFFKAAALVPFLNVLPEEKVLNFIECFKKVYYKICNTNELEVQMTRLFISARK